MGNERSLLFILIPGIQRAIQKENITTSYVQGRKDGLRYHTAMKVACVEAKVLTRLKFLSMLAVYGYVVFVLF